MLLRRTTSALAAVMVVGAVAAAFAVAAKAPPLTQTSVTFEALPNVTVQKAAECSGKAEVVSGGFLTQVGEGAVVLPTDSSLVTSNRWTLKAFNAGASAGTATAYGYCAKPPILDVSKLGFTSIEANSLGGVEHDCRADHGEFAIGGGFEVQSDLPAHVLVSKLVAPGIWRAEAYNPNGESIGFSSETSCDERKAKLRTRRAQTIVSAGASESVIAKCKPKEKLISGGFQNILEAPGSDGFTHGSRRLGKRSWEVTSHALTGSLTLTAYAYCAKKP